MSCLKLFNLFKNWYNWLCINVSSADINHINFETLTKDLNCLHLFSILYTLSCLESSSFRHSKRTCISSSTVNLHRLQIRWSAEMLKYLPCSISKLWEFILNFVINRLWQNFPTLNNICWINLSLKSLYVHNLLLQEAFWLSSKREFLHNQGSQNVPATGDFTGYFWLSAVYKFVKNKNRSW